MNIVFLILVFALVLSVLAVACVSMVELGPSRRHADHRPNAEKGKKPVHRPRTG